MPVRRLPTRAVIGSIIALTGVLVAASATIAALRGNHDEGLGLLGGIGRPPHTRAAATAPDPAGRRLETALVAVTVPHGWSTVSSTDDEVVVSGPHAVLDLAAGRAGSGLTDANLVDDTVSSYQRRYPDAHLCRAPSPAALDNGPDGVAFALCYTVTPLNGLAIATDALVVEALVPEAGRSPALYRETAVFADEDATRAVAEVAPVARGVEWRRFRSPPLTGTHD